MRSKVRKSTLGTLAVVLLATGTAFARFPGHGHSSQKSGSIDVTQTTRVPNGPTLEPGTYKVTLINGSTTPEVEFRRTAKLSDGWSQDGKLVGQAPVKLVDQDKKIDQTQFEATKQDDGTWVMDEIDLSGWTQKITFGASGAASAASSSGE